MKKNVGKRSFNAVFAENGDTVELDKLVVGGYYKMVGCGYDGFLFVCSGAYGDYHLPTAFALCNDGSFDNDDFEYFVDALDKPMIYAATEDQIKLINKYRKA